MHVMRGIQRLQFGGGQVIRYDCHEDLYRLEYGWLSKYDQILRGSINSIAKKGFERRILRKKWRLGGPLK